MAEDRVTELAGLMQQAALDSTRWEAALDAANAFVGGNGVALLSVRARQKFAPSSTDMAEMMEDYFVNGWYANDRRESCIPLLKANGIVCDHEFQSEADIVNCDYYDKFLVRHRRKWFAGVGVDVEGDNWCLALQRSPEAGPFGSNDKRALRILRELLANAANLALHAGHSWMSGLQHGLELTGQPAVVFDSSARIYKVNDAALAVLTPWITKEKRLSFTSSRMTAAFDRMLRSALLPMHCLSDRGSHDKGLETTICLGEQSYRCRATSLLRQEGLIATSAAALVVMQPVPRSPADLLRERHGLTEAEIRVAMAIAGGKSTEEVAADHRVGVGTVRAQIKSVFSKTETNRQSKLVAFVRDLASDKSKRQ